jgi:hypothetical protein
VSVRYSMNIDKEKNNRNWSINMKTKALESSGIPREEARELATHWHSEQEIGSLSSKQRGRIEASSRSKENPKAWPTKNRNRRPEVSANTDDRDTQLTRLATKISKQRDISHQKAMGLAKKQLKRQAELAAEQKRIEAENRRKAGSTLNKTPKGAREGIAKGLEQTKEVSGRRLVEITYTCGICASKFSEVVSLQARERETRVRLSHLEKHYLSEHNLTREEVLERTRREMEAEKDSFEVLPWALLPPDHTTFALLMAYYKSIEKELLSKHRGNVDEERLKKVTSLKPDRVYRGSDGFHGYTVFEFDRYEKVILECPVYGNAVYFLYKDSWKSQARKSKQYIRENFPGSWGRVRHTESWFRRVREELSLNGFQ